MSNEDGRLSVFSLQDKFNNYGLAKLIYIREILFPDGMNDFHVRLFILMNYPVSESAHLNHSSGKRF